MLKIRQRRQMLMLGEGIDIVAVVAQRASLRKRGVQIARR